MTKKHDTVVIDQGLAYYRCRGGEVKPDSIAIGNKDVSCKTCLKMIAKYNETVYHPLEHYDN